MRRQTYRDNSRRRARRQKGRGGGRKARDGGRPKPRPRTKSRAQAEFDALYDRFLADARANRATARRRGVHAYMTDDAPGIIRQARALIRLGRLPGMAAETLAETIVEYERMRARAAQAQTRAGRESRKARQPAPEPRARPPATAAAQSPKPDPAGTARTRPPAGPTPEPTAAAREARERHPARIERTAAGIGKRPATPASRPDRRAPAPKPPPRERTPDELYRDLRRRCNANRKAARARGIEPYETEDWRAIHEAAKHLVNRDDAPDGALPYIRELISGYYSWDFKQRPRHDPQTQSIRIRY